MKKILALIVLSVVMVSCYEDYLVDYPITSIYFPLQQNVRTFIVGEGMKIEVGASLGGIRQNDKDRNVSFVLDPALVTPERLTALKTSSWTYIKDATAAVTTLKQLPVNFYAMTPSTTTMVIKSGWHGGTVVIKADSTNFLNDSVNTKISTYVLPFKITAADADTVLASKSTAVIGVKFENMLYGNYWHGGAALINRPSKSDTTIYYKTTVPVAENLIWNLTTEGPSTLSCNGYYKNVVTATRQFRLVKKGTKLFLSPLAGASQVITQDGECTYNDAKLLQNRKIILKYKYTEAAAPFYTYHCTDTLTFRNRMHDGINEWQDGDPSHYTK
jgi:hypothetical protein